MNKYIIVALFGEAGSGKDYILRHIYHTDWGKNDTHQIIHSTTRTPREHEKDGVQYHFMTAAEFLTGNNLLKWIECSFFNSWWYGVSLDDLDIDKINIGIFSIEGIKQLKEKDNLIVIPIRIKTYDKIRLMRQLEREENPNCFEICRRFISDKNDFGNIPFEYHVIENNTFEVQPIINDIRDIVNEEVKMNQSLLNDFKI